MHAKPSQQLDRLTQLALPFRNGHGGARCGAGRKPFPAHRRHTPHRARPAHRAAHPVHVTLRSFVRSLRSKFVARTVLNALRAGNSERFRIVHYSVQENHVHLIVEAESAASLSAGVRSLMVRIARRVNTLLFRRGRFWADRWHGHALKGPREVRNALVYVLQNRKKHARGRHVHATATIDPLSSAPWFDGFVEPRRNAPRNLEPPSGVAARTWLLSVGWRRHGRVRLEEGPATARHATPRDATPRHATPREAPDLLEVRGHSRNSHRVREEFGVLLDWGAF
jgi:REP element-mobilizing transposase RayT